MATTKKLFQLLCIFVFCAKVSFAGVTLHDLSTEEDYDESPERLSNSTYAEDQSALQRHIMNRYPRKYKPLLNQTLQMNIQMHVYLMHYSVNQDEQTVSLIGYIYMSWIDEYAVWDPSRFNNVRFTLAKQWELWQPELKIANSVSGVNQYFEISKRSHATLESLSPTKTKVQIYPTFHIKIGCNFDYSAYPLDTQTCILRMYPQGRMNDISLSDYFGLRPSMILSWGENADLKHVDEWKVADLSNNITYFSQRQFLNEKPRTIGEQSRTWTVFCVYLILERKIMGRFLMMLGLPCLICSIINITSFLVTKTDHGIIITVFNLFIQVIFLQDSLRELPPAIGKPPAIVTFTNALFSMTLLAMVVHLANKKFGFASIRLPKKCSAYINQTLQNIKNKRLTTEPVSMSSIEEGSSQVLEAAKKTKVPVYTVGVVVMFTFSITYTIITLGLIMFCLL